MANTDGSWDRLNRFARTIKIESFSVLGLRIQFNPRTLASDSFSLLLQKARKRPERENDVYVLSAHNLDQINTVDKIDPDHECEALSDTISAAGGSGANTAFTLARLGATVRICGIVGNDSDGQTLTKSLKDADVDVSGMVLDRSQPTGKTVTLVEEGGKRLIVVFPGANNHLAAQANVEQMLNAAHSSRIVHLSSFVGDDEQRLQEELLQRLPRDTFVSLTPGAIYSRQGLDRLQGLLARVDVIFLYREQLLELIENSSAALHNRGADVQRLMEAFFAWKKAHAITGPQVLVVKDRLGHTAGTIDQRFLCVGVGEVSLERYISPKQLPKGVKIPAMDTTGSGDAAAAGFLTGILHQATLEQCIDAAFLMAGFISTSLGARTAVQDQSVVDSLLQGGRPGLRLT